MVSKKKLQVFVSSTYTDLRDERQAAVEAILTAGHIPAGMELFAAGDESQMNVIKRWIDESDVYLLILGGRYGSLEAKSKKSYIHLEYEYALAQGKPLFAVVIDEKHAKERVKTHPLGTDVIETDNPQKLKKFRSLVTSKMVKFWSDHKDIRLAIVETLGELSRREDLKGWIPGDESVSTAEVARLVNENAALRKQLASLTPQQTTYNGVTFEEMYKLLAAQKVKHAPGSLLSQRLQEVNAIFGDKAPALIHAFWIMSNVFKFKQIIKSSDATAIDLARRLEDFGLVEYDETRSNDAQGEIYALTDTGRQFLVRLRLERDTRNAERHRF